MKGRFLWGLGVYLWGFGLHVTVLAQGTLQDYQRAEQLLPQNVEQLISGTQAQPHWLEESVRFWYRKDVYGGNEFVLVDARAGSKSPAFDHETLAAALSDTLDATYTATTLPFNAIEFVEDGKAIQFDINDTRWVCDLETYELTIVEQTDPPAVNLPTASGSPL